MTTSTPSQARARPLSPRRRSALITLGVVLAVLAVEGFLIRHYRAVELERAGESFGRIVDQATVSLYQQTSQYQGALLGLRALFIASEEVSGLEFYNYSGALRIERTLPGLRAFAFNRRVAAADQQAYTEWIRAKLSSHDPIYAGFEIYPAERNGGERHVVEIIYPAVGNQRSLGYDMLSDDTRREAIENAHANGFATTPPIRLQQAPSSTAVLMLAPVSTRSWNGANADGHTVAASFLVADLVDAAISPTLRRHFHLRITDLGSGEQPDHSGGLLFDDPMAAPPDPGVMPPMIRNQVFGGRQWELRFTPRERSISAVPTPLLIILLAGGALLAGLTSHLLQQRIRRAARHRALALQAADCVLELDKDGTVVVSDECAARITGRTAGMWLERPLWESVASEDAASLRTAFEEALARARPTTVECRALTADAGLRWIEVRLGSHIAQPHIGAVLAQISDIDARKQAELEIQRLAFFDPLTALPNRRLLEQRAELTFSTAKRHRSRASVLVLDLDGFKQINDEAGHATGDAVLAVVAQRLQAAVRDSDTVARLGGDEFAILLGEPANEVDIRAAAARVIRDMALPLKVNGREWYVSASIGIAVYPDHGQRFADLLSLADTAMYRSKRRGSGLFTMADLPAPAPAPGAE